MKDTMTFKTNKKNLIDDTKELIAIGVDRTKLLKAIKNGVLDETIRDSGDSMKTHELGDLCNQLVDIL